MKIEVNDNTIKLEETGTIKTIINENYSRIENGCWPKIIDEFYISGDTVQTQVNSLLIQPNTYKKRTFNYRDEDYLKREITEKNRSLSSIGKDFNTSGGTIRDHVKEHDIKRPLESKEQLEELWEEHGSISDIAKDINAETYEVKIALEQKNIIDPYDNNKVIHEG